MRVIDINENQVTAAEVAATAKSLLADKGFQVRTTESLITVGSVMHDDLRIHLKYSDSVKMGGEPGGALPPYLIQTASFQDKGRQLTNLFQHLNRSKSVSPQDINAVVSAPAPENEPEEGSYIVPYIKDLGLSSDAALLIRVGGIAFSRREIIDNAVKGLVIGVLSGGTLTTGMSRDVSGMDIFLLNAQTGEVLWRGDFSGGGTPNNDTFKWNTEKLLEKLPELKSKQEKISS